LTHNGMTFFAFHFKMVASASKYNGFGMLTFVLLLGELLITNNFFLYT
jgi:hypothetical protein